MKTACFRGKGLWFGWAALLAVAGVLLSQACAAQCAARNSGACSSGAPKCEWTPLFNGTDLDGWMTEGNAAWRVEDGCIVGTQGPGNAPGDLFTEKEYGDFEVRITYKIQWPANSGIWFRYQSPDKSYQADILEYKDPECYSGTLYCPAKMFLSMNEDPNLEKRDDWNTMIIRAEGDHLTVTLNGTVVGDVHDASYATGRIGFQVHPGDEFKDMKITVREAAIREVKP
ncbi:MAG: DUF1080 domain-containing protein [Candidatus Hydrogenedentes bacterium]|nr:DUF1080 domain-containing protein [Candidatus Hydrogenedentota bacterium]